MGVSRAVPSWHLPCRCLSHLPSGWYCAMMVTVCPAPLSAAAACSWVAPRRSMPFTCTGNQDNNRYEQLGSDRDTEWDSVIIIPWMLRSGGCPDAEAKYKIKKAERKLTMSGWEDTYQYHSPHSLCSSMQILWSLFLGVSCSTEFVFLVISSSSNIT